MEASQNSIINKENNETKNNNNHSNYIELDLNKIREFM